MDDLERPRLRVSDVPETLQRNAGAARWACMLVVLVAVAAQFAAAFEWIDDPMLPLGLGFLSSAAMGIDAIVIGVRKRADAGPSISNLAPGGWALFGAMLWIVAVPAYLFGVRRRALREARETVPCVEDEEQSYERVTPGSWVAIAVVAAVGVLTSLASHLG